MQTNKIRIRTVLSALMATLLAAVLVTPPSTAHAADQTCVVDCVTTYDVAASASALGPGNGPFAITRGPLNSEWFAWGDAVGRIDEAGEVTRYPVPTEDPLMRWMVRGKHGKMWFSERNKIGWIRTSAAGTELREYSLPHEDAFAISLVVGPRGKALERGGEALVPQTQVRPAFGDVRRRFLRRHPFRAH